MRDPGYHDYDTIGEMSPRSLARRQNGSTSSLVLTHNNSSSLFFISSLLFASLVCLFVRRPCCIITSLCIITYYPRIPYLTCCLSPPLLNFGNLYFFIVLVFFLSLFPFFCEKANKTESDLLRAWQRKTKECSKLL